MLGPESAPTVQMPRGIARSGRDLALQVARILRHSGSGSGSTSIPPRRLRGTQRRQHRLGSGPAGERAWVAAIPSNSRAPRMKCSRPKCSRPASATARVDLDVGEALNGSEPPTNKLQGDLHAPHQQDQDRRSGAAGIGAGDHERGRHQARSGARLHGYGRSGRRAQHPRGSRAAKAPRARNRKRSA